MPSEVPWMQKMGWQAGLCSGPRWGDYSALISITGGKGACCPSQSQSTQGPLHSDVHHLQAVRWL